MNRAELIKSIDRLGGKLKSSATADTNYFVIGGTNFQLAILPEWLIIKLNEQY